MNDRRKLLIAAAAAPAALTAACASTGGGTQTGSKTYVLLHGAFHGGWCWQRVAEPLRAAGHRVYTPTQTGLGERAHLLSADIGINVFIQDLVNVIEAEELRDIILVGHSFGGLAITGAADRLPERIRHIVYLDAVVMQNGQSVFSTFPKELVEARLKIARDHDGGKSFPAFKPEAFAVTDPADQAWLARRLTSHPAKTYSEPITLRNPPAHGLKRTFIRCTKPLYAPVNASADWVRRQSGWNYLELASGHDAMVTAPRELTEMLLGIG
jgi:pimeloyl-ACP methyl ester carboxylesterase